MTSSPPTEMTPNAADGRTARRERNRIDVVDATLALFDEGNLDPSMADVSARSGVSERSVFRYFDSLDDLRKAVIRRNFERASPLLHLKNPGQGEFSGRVRQFVDVRLRLWRVVAGPARVARLRAPYVEDIAAEVRHFRELLDGQVRVHFRPELSALPRAQADDLRLMVDVVVSFDSWDLLTTAHGCSESQVRRAWNSTVTRLLPG